MNCKNIKIAFNIDHFIPSRGGAERYLYNLVMYLLKNGCEVHVFAMDGQDTISKPHNNFIFHNVPVIGWFRWLKSLSFVIMSSIFIKKRKFDIVQVLGKNLTMDVFQPHGGSHRASFRQNVLASSENTFIRFLYGFFRLFDLKQILFFIIEWLQFHKRVKPHLLCISKMVLSDIKNYYSVEERKTHLIYNGVDTKRFSLYSRNLFRETIRRELGFEDNSVLLFVGHNFKLKGLKYFLESMAVIKKTDGNIKLKSIIAGNGDRKKYMVTAENLGLKNDCVFIDSADNIEKYYSAADVLVQPTFYDPCSLVVIEALSCGLPVVTTSYNGAGELIKQGETGFVVKTPRMVEEIAKSAKYFLDLAKNASIANTVSESVKDYDNDKIYKQTLDFYLSVINYK